MEHGSQLYLDACPYCGIANPNLYAKGVESGKHLFWSQSADARNSRCWGTYVCASCGGVILAGADGFYNGRTWEATQIELIFPTPRAIPREIPERTRAYLQDAANTLAAPAASVMVSASAVDSMLKAKGYKEGALYARIQKTVEDHVITNEMAEWAHQVRLDANGQRHADDEEVIPTKVDAERSLEFALALAEFLFVLPARVTRGLTQSKDTTPAK